MELIGCDETGFMSLWQMGTVKPVSAFERYCCNGVEVITADHYVIDWHGHAITVHCSSRGPDHVSVNFMCSGGAPKILRTSVVEALLLGKVMKDPEHEKKIRRLFADILEALAARNAPPHRQRGKIT